VSDARAEIHDLLVRLAIAQDDHDWDTLTAHFAPDAVYDHPGGRLVGVDDIARVSDADAVFTMMDPPSVVGRDAIIDVMHTWRDGGSVAVSFSWCGRCTGLGGGERRAAPRARVPRAVRPVGRRRAPLRVAPHRR
jgi:hypothetical protein